MRIAGLLLAAILPPAAVYAQWKTPWSYQGPRGAAHWSELDPDYAPCNLGKQQSPVDIRNTVRADLPALRFDYHNGPLKYLINNGYTIRVNYHDAAGTGNFLVVDGKRYQLTQFHFHRPSEEYVHGKAYPMVIHFMHVAEDGKIAGVAVFIEAGKPNATVQRIWDHMPAAAGGEQEFPGVAIDPAGLLPAGMGYYTYMGSVSAPPCTEGVAWFVLKTPIKFSPAQIDKFARLYPHDVRPIQRLNGRVVRESQ